MSTLSPSDAIDAARFELALLLTALMFGLLILPALIYAVGVGYFGESGAGGFWGFFAGMHASIRRFDAAAWFLVLAPYLGIQLLRGGLLAFRSLR